MAAPLDKLFSKLDEKEYLADIFHILHFDELDSPTATAGDHFRLLVPKSLDDLFVNWSTESEQVVAALVTWARPETRKLSPTALTLLVDTIRSRYLLLRQFQYLSAIPDEDDAEIRELMNQLLPSAPAQAGILARMKDTVRKSVGTVLSQSKKAGKAIFMYGRDLARFVGDRITQAELPAKADAMVKKKAEMTGRLYAFKGGHATKVFIGIALSTAGLFTANPLVGGAGLVLAFVDP
jgi:hypothetical protein